MKTFQIPDWYKSTFISNIKQQRKMEDKMKKDFTPSILQFGSLKIILARHFGFCYGVENAIEIAFKAIAENEGKRIFLLSEMIHNPGVNSDLIALGIRFIMDTNGNLLLDWDEVNSNDIVIIPAFGTTLETEQLIKEKGIDPKKYETTCPFVEKVWNRAEKIGDEGYTLIIHGKPQHEETRATFSHSKRNAPSVVVKDIEEAKRLALYINNEMNTQDFYEEFKGQFSLGFNVERDLQKIGVVNQTTMLASETQAISEFLKQTIIAKHNLQSENIVKHFADTRDTLCYATNDNQTAVITMLQEKADFALVIGGYNSSNTSHLVELCEEKLTTYFINDETCLLEINSIRHFDIHHKSQIISHFHLSGNEEKSILITSGASCPDALVEKVIRKLVTLTGNDFVY